MDRNVCMNTTELSSELELIGTQLLEIITVGMYNDCRMIYREYIQNAADSVDEAIARGIIRPREAQIKIAIDTRHRNITIEDNGIGVNVNEIEKALCSLGISKKDNSTFRGFRGIGRLGGLGYCDLLQFETRGAADENVTVVSWDSKHLGKIGNDLNGLGLEAAIRRIVSIESRPAERKEPSHFFRARLLNVHQFHRDELMNVTSIRKYLSQMAPIPFDKNRFSFTKQIEDRLSKISGYKHYHITVNGERLFKPYTDEVAIRNSMSDQISSIEFFDLTGENGGIIASGWYAVTGFLASIPPSVGIGGIRVRQGNIDVGGESILDGIYTEKRFSSWHIGEIHVGYGLRLNARRDYFEPSPGFERFLEQTYFLGRHLSNLCRDSSKARVIEKTIENKVAKLEEELDSVVFVDTDQLGKKVEPIDQMIANIEDCANNGNRRKDLLTRIERVRKRFVQLKDLPSYLETCLDARTFEKMGKKELLRSVCHAIANGYDQTSTAEELIFNIIKPYLTPTALKAIGQLKSH